MMNSTKLIELLHRCYGADTACGEWKPTVPALNQCAVAALVVQDMCGGTILRAPMSDGDGHYYNAINGEHVDPTESQLEHIDATVDFGKASPRTRQYILSYPDTMRRYSILLGRLSALLTAEEQE